MGAEKSEALPSPADAPGAADPVDAADTELAGAPPSEAEPDRAPQVHPGASATTGSTHAHARTQELPCIRMFALPAMATRGHYQTAPGQVPSNFRNVVRGRFAERAAALRLPPC
jgi:hypothetical protein